MSQQDLLTESDIDTLINLLLRSQQSRTREALCFSIGIDPKRLSFLRDSSDSDFFLFLIRYLNEIGDQEALCKLCHKELVPIFNKGTYGLFLSELAGKLNCSQEFRQNYPNNKQPTSSSSSPAPSISVNPINQLVKNKLVIGSAIFIIGLAGFSLYNEFINLLNGHLSTDPFINQTPNLNLGDSCDVPADTFMKKGDDYSSNKNYDDAIVYYTQAIELNPKCSYAYSKRGDAYNKKKKSNLAIIDFDRAINIDPKLADAYNGLGNTYKYLWNASKDKKYYDKAIANYSTAIKLKPDFAYAYLDRANLYIDKGCKNLAVRDLEEVRKLNNNDEANKFASETLQKLSQVDINNNDQSCN